MFPAKSSNTAKTRSVVQCHEVYYDSMKQLVEPARPHTMIQAHAASQNLHGRKIATYLVITNTDFWHVSARQNKVGAKPINQTWTCKEEPFIYRQQVLQRNDHRRNSGVRSTC